MGQSERDFGLELMKKSKLKNKKKIKKKKKIDHDGSENFLYTNSMSLVVRRTTRTQSFTFYNALATLPAFARVELRVNEISRT